MKILLAVDGSEYTQRMLYFLGQHRDTFGPQHVFTVLTSVSGITPGAARYFAAEVIEEYYRDEAEKAFVTVREKLIALGIEKAAFMTGHGPAATAIVAEAEAGGHDLIMMGSHGHGALMGMTLGSVTQKVIAQSRAPVLVVR